MINALLSEKYKGLYWSSNPSKKVCICSAFRARLRLSNLISLVLWSSFKAAFSAWAEPDWPMVCGGEEGRFWRFAFKIFLESHLAVVGEMSALARCHLHGQKVTCAPLWLAVGCSWEIQPCFLPPPNSQSAGDNISRGQGWVLVLLVHGLKSISEFIFWWSPSPACPW